MALVIAVVAAAPAHAEFEGTPGKVAYVDGAGDLPPLKVWDPARDETTTIEAQTVERPSASDVSNGVQSAPVWSPDGTKLAYVKSIDKTGNSPIPVMETAIFVYDLKTGKSDKLTDPPEALVDPNPTDDKIEGHGAADFDPAWSPSGNTLAFIRQIGAFKDDSLYAKRGANVWTIPTAGGSPVQATHHTDEQPPTFTGGMVWIPGSNDVLIGQVDKSGTTLVRQPVAGGGATTVASAQPIVDFDVSPDGKRFGFTTAGAAGVTGFEGDLATGAATEQGDWHGGMLRYSNTGSGLLRQGCLPREPESCGLIERLREDPDADINPDEKDRMMLKWPVLTSVAGGGFGVPGRMLWDVQPQKLPVIFIPGFLGSRIDCGGETLWPRLPFPDLLLMRLSDDGLVSSDCALAQPTGDLVERVLGISDVYGSVADYVRSAYPNGRGTLFGWDWRKRPQESFPRLRSAIDDALERDGPWKDQQAGRVVLWAHSYGGLLVRSFVAGADGQRVARVLTEGTPYWGSPKAIFPLAFGIESPLFSALDVLINNDKLKAFAVNLAGLYNLYPSDRYGPWLTVGGATQGHDGVAAFVRTLGGNDTLFEQAQGYHDSLYERFYDDGGRIDTRIVVGTGLPTIGNVSFANADDGGVIAAGTFTNGDETVPGRSATQGAIGTRAPFGDPVHIQYSCNVSHVPLPGNKQVLDAYADFIDHGAVPRKLPGPCSARGGVYHFRASSIGQTPTRSARASGPLNLDDAEQQGLIDLIEMPRDTLAVVDDDLPATLQVPIAGATFTYTPLKDDTQGTTLTYGPLTGLLVLKPGAPGGAPTVTLNGMPVAPHGAPPGGGAGSAGGSPTPPVGTTPATRKPARLVFLRRPKLRGRKLTVTVRAPRSGALRVAATQHGRTVGSAKARLRRAGRKTLTLRLKRRPHGLLRITITLKPRGAAALRLKAKLRAR